MILDASTPETTPARLRSLIDSFKGKRILVIGDMVADQYLIGRPTRISREAPVLILELDEERTIPGGASNVAVNANSLGAEVFLTGVIGDDLPGQQLRKAISDLHMHQEGLCIDPTATHFHQNTYYGRKSTDRPAAHRTYRPRGYIGPG